MKRFFLYEKIIGIIHSYKSNQKENQKDIFEGDIEIFRISLQLSI